MKKLSERTKFWIVVAVIVATLVAVWVWVRS
mgnify:FL=1